jgi:hypothetical protein
MRNLLGAALPEYRFSREWHYAINMEDTNSLASYLRINHEQLPSLLLALGWHAFMGNYSSFKHTGITAGITFALSRVLKAILTP